MARPSSRRSLRAEHAEQLLRAEEGLLAGDDAQGGVEKVAVGPSSRVI